MEMFLYGIIGGVVGQMLVLLLVVLVDLWQALSPTESFREQE